MSLTIDVNTPIETKAGIVYFIRTHMSMPRYIGNNVSFFILVNCNTGNITLVVDCAIVIPGYCGAIRCFADISLRTIVLHLHYGGVTHGMDRSCIQTTNSYCTDKKQRNNQAFFHTHCVLVGLTAPSTVIK